MKSQEEGNVEITNVTRCICQDCLLLSLLVRRSFRLTCLLTPTLVLFHVCSATRWPIDEEVAQYLCAHAIASAGPQHNANDIKKALEDARRRNPANSFDGRVSEALISLGLG